MGAHLSPDVVADLDDIWHYVATVSGNAGTADRLIACITDLFLLLAGNPYLGRPRDDAFRPGLRSFPVGSYVVIYRVEGDDVLILHVTHGRRDIPSLFSHLRRMSGA